MDFIDFEPFQDDDQLPQPQPALSLPISSNIESLGKKFTTFNSLTRNLLNFDDDDHDRSVSESSEESKLAQKYASLSLNLIENHDESSNKNVSDEEKNDTSAKSKLQMNTNKSSTKTLSSRLSRVLNTPLSDSLIREIFSTLELKIDGVENLVEPGVIGSVSRKQFRGSIEGDLIKYQSLVLKEYQPAIKQLKLIEERLTSLNNLLESASKKIFEDFESTKGFNEQVQNLKRKHNVIQLRKSLLMNFKNKFTLNEYEEYVLTNGEINDEFFQTLVKAEKISEDCSILLSLDNTQLGLKIMNKVNQLINKSVDRIITYTNKTLANLYSLNTRSRLETLHKCMRYLKNKLNYFNSIISNFVESRSKVIVDEFIVQLGGNLDRRSRLEKSDSSSRLSVSSGQSGRPIILSAHDPVRFIGDLLAYVHSVVVNENELISSIFTLESTSEAERKEFESISKEITSKSLKALSRPLKSKIDQTLSSEMKLSTVFQISNLLDLYNIMFSKQLKDEDSSLIGTIRELVKVSQEKIISIIKNRLLTIKNSNLAQLDLNTDLQPPEWIIEFYFDLLPIIDQITTDTILNLPKNENENFVNLIVNEPIEIFNTHVQNNNVKLFNKRDQLILRQNFLDLVLSKIMPLSLLSDKTLEISDQINGVTLELTQLQLLILFDECKLTDYYNIVNMICPFEDEFFDVSIYEPITENKLFNAEKVKEVNENIQQFLPSALLDIQQSLLKINSPIIVNDIITNSSIEFIKFYKKFDILCQTYLSDPVLIWSDYEVATLLGVEESYLEVKKSMIFD